MKPRFLIHILLLAILGMVAGGCTHTPDARLLRAESMMTDSLPQARAMLDSIDRTSLSEADRNLRDLLTIKAADKSYVKHTADSTILRLVDYYGHHQSSGRYPEALYYAGRVYSDLGDYPTALEYYHKAINLLDPANNSCSLKVRVLSQMARIYNSMRLYDSCIPLLQEAIEIDVHLKDTLNELRDKEFLGNVYMNKGEYDRAENIFGEVYVTAGNRYPKIVLRQRLYLGAVKYYKGAYDSALNILRGIPELKMNDHPGTALLFAANTYMQLGICDTAYRYAKILSEIESSPNRKAGYKLLLSDPLKSYVSSDSARTYALKLSELTDKYMEENGNRDALLQKSIFNYDRHDRDRQKEEVKRKRVMFWLIITGFVLCINVIVVLIIAYRNKERKFQATKAQDEVRDLKLKLSVSENRYQELVQATNVERLPAILVNENSLQSKDLDDSESSVYRLRESMIAKFREVCPQIKANPPVKDDILESETYVKIKSLVAAGKGIPDKSSLWHEIENMILDVSPDFKTMLYLLVGGKMEEFNYQMALLIRCGLRPMQIATLINKAKNTISTRRTKLVNDIFGDEMKMKPIYFDYVVLLL